MSTTGACAGCGSTLIGTHFQNCPFSGSGFVRPSTEWVSHEERIAAALERIADALESAEKRRARK